METATVAERRIGIRDYFEILFEIIRSPARYYQKVANETGSRNALFFLMISAVFYCSVSMAYFFENSLAMGVVMMINAVVMPVFSAAITFILLSMTGLGRVSYGRVFNIYGYASGAVMVVSWIPRSRNSHGADSSRACLRRSGQDDRSRKDQVHFYCRADSSPAAAIFLDCGPSRLRVAATAELTVGHEFLAHKARCILAPSPSRTAGRCARPQWETGDKQ